MEISRSRIGLNRKIMPKQDLKTFFELCNSFGINKIELRNDLTDDDDTMSIIDNLSIEEFNQLKESYDIGVETINAITFFNNPNELEKNKKQLEELCQLSAKIKNKMIIFCPDVDAKDSRTEMQKITDAATALKEYADILDQHGIKGLVEPLGFVASTLRYPWQASQAIKQAGVAKTFKIVIDSFHFYLAHITEAQFKEKMSIDEVGLVHLSGVEPTNELRELVDDDRVLLTKNDIMQNVEQAKLFETLGYKGNYSFEPFAPSFGSYSEQYIESLLQESLTFIE